jgi:hypothetical protein
VKCAHGVARPVQNLWAKWLGTPLTLQEALLPMIVYCLYRAVSTELAKVKRALNLR